MVGAGEQTGFIRINYFYAIPGYSSKGSPKPNRVRGEIGRSSKGVIPQAKVRTVKMTFFIVLGKYNHIYHPYPD